MKTIIAIVTICITLLISNHSFAASSSEVLESMKKARESLIALLETPDKGVQTTLISDIHSASAEADKLIEAIIADPATTPEAKTKMTEAKDTWAEFKKTREEEIIPQILAGEADKAKEIAGGIQKERFKKIVELLK